MSYGLLLDILIIILLGATIFYAMRLSKYLEQFRSNRSDMERLIRDLSMQITRAQEGISTLDQLTKDNSDELRSLLIKGRGLADELQIMNEVGDNLASRLEMLSSSARMGAQEQSRETGKPVFAAPTRQKAEPAQTGASALFSIRDPDYDDDDDTKALSSKAEKELARALKKQK
jgi:hypothetical protein